MSDIIELTITVLIILVVFTIMYFMGKSEKKHKHREALLPFTSGEKVPELKIQYKMKWIYYISLFSVFEAITMLLLLSIGTLIAVEIGVLFGIILLIAIWIAPSVEEVEF